MITQVFLFLFLTSLFMIGAVGIIYGLQCSKSSLANVARLLRGKTSTPTYLYQSKQGKGVTFNLGELHPVEFKEGLEEFKEALGKLELIAKTDAYEAYGYQGRISWVKFRTSTHSAYETDQAEHALLQQINSRTQPGTEIDNAPPKLAQYLLYFLPKKDREPLLGDLEEEHREIYEKFGRRKATFWYYCQVAMSFRPYLASAIRKLYSVPRNSDTQGARLKVSSPYEENIV